MGDYRRAIIMILPWHNHRDVWVPSIVIKRPPTKQHIIIRRLSTCNPIQHQLLRLLITQVPGSGTHFFGWQRRQARECACYPRARSSHRRPDTRGHRLAHHSRDQWVGREVQSRGVRISTTNQWIIFVHRVRSPANRGPLAPYSSKAPPSYSALPRTPFLWKSASFAL